MQHTKFNRGFTLVELIITITVLAILAGLAVPSFTETLEKRRLIGAAEQLKNDLQYARSEAIKRNANVFVTFVASGTATWCYGIDTATCDCATANDCQLDGITRVVDQSGFRGVSADENFGDADLTFSPRRLTLDNGHAAFTTATHEVRVVAANLGRIKLCSPAGATYISAYQACN